MSVSRKESSRSLYRDDKVHLVTLGCPKNEVDSETIYASLQKEGFLYVNEPSFADVVIINTCSFIQEAIEESLDVILELSENKLSGKGCYLVVVGCLVQRYGQKLLDMLPEVDLLVGTKLATAVGSILADYIDGRTSKRTFLESSDLCSISTRLLPLQRRSSGVSAYLKVSEGCSNRCSYCTIPYIRGSIESRPEKEILAEALELAFQGTLEVNLIAQDVAAYGHDKGRGKETALPRLIQKLIRIEPLRWIRLLYCHPAHVGKGLIELFGDEEKLCPYLDLPIQHVSKHILEAMNRPYSEDELRRLIDRLRTKCPDIALRTTVMVGFPGETERDFEQVLAFIKDISFHHVGTFCYSHEEGTPAYHKADGVSKAEKIRRHEAVMNLQAEISAVKNRDMVGTLQEVLVEGPHEETPLLLRGRTRYQAPAVDGIVCINKGHLPRPGMAKVKITDSNTYDLVGEIISD